ncbi:MAG: endonuclease/exonuclease/phosphatase family protein, partial [Persicimonas sp.]
MKASRVVIAALAPLVVWPLTACDPFDTGFEEVEDAESYRASKMTAPPDDVDELTVMSWNIKFAGGRIDFFYDCHGERVIMEKDEVLEHLEGLAEKIEQVDPDVLILQEVDVDSKRTAEIDQVEWLLEHTDLNYGAYASQWRSRYIPKHGLGKVDSGNAILARWPLEDAERTALPLIEAQDPITRYFYLKRNILRARLEVPDREPLWVIDTHTAAFATDDTRARQIDRVEEELARLDEADKTFVMGADLNTVPPHSERRKDFPDTSCDDEN